MQRFMRVKDVAAAVGLSRAEWYARVKKGTAPQPIPLAPADENGHRHVVVWLSDEIATWQAQQIAAARPQLARTA